jgi:hypothetical protein
MVLMLAARLVEPPVQRPAAAPASEFTDGANLRLPSRPAQGELRERVVPRSLP